MQRLQVVEASCSREGEGEGGAFAQVSRMMELESDEGGNDDDLQSTADEERSNMTSPLHTRLPSMTITSSSWCPSEITENHCAALAALVLSPAPATTGVGDKYNQNLLRFE